MFPNSRVERQLEVLFCFGVIFYSFTEVSCTALCSAHKHSAYVQVDDRAVRKNTNITTYTFTPMKLDGVSNSLHEAVAECGTDSCMLLDQRHVHIPAYLFAQFFPPPINKSVLIS